MSEKPFSGRLRLRVCALILKQKQLLLALHDSPTRQEPIWLPPGGEVEFGESMESALKREVSEECGLNVTVGDLLLVHEFLEPPFHAIEFYYRCQSIGGELATGSDPELPGDQQIIRDLAFKNLKELPGLHLYPEWLKENSHLLLIEGAEIKYITSSDR